MRSMRLRRHWAETGRERTSSLRVMLSSSASLRSPAAVRWNLRAGGRMSVAWSADAQKPSDSSFAAAS